MNKKTILKGFIAAILSITMAAIFGGSASYAEAVITRGLYTDSNDVRWEWQKTIDADNVKEPEKVSIMFYDKPAAATTIVVPSLSDVIAAASATSTLNTYYVRNADEESQAANFTENGQEKRVSTADVTKLDMSNTSKVQILGVKPIINPEVETELVFGENMVIGDGLHITNVFIAISWCKKWTHEYYMVDDDGRNYYYCSSSASQYLQTSEIAGWDDMTLDEQIHLQINVEDYGYVPRYTNRYLYEDEYDESIKYVLHEPQVYISTEREISQGAFSGYKLKLTNFGGFNYVGWRAFYNSTFNAANTTITIDGTALKGDEIFAKTNIQKVIFDATETGSGLFKDCEQLTEVEFGADVDTIYSETFRNTNLGSLDLSSTNIKTVNYLSFGDAHLSSLNLGNIEYIDTYAFQNNHDLTEIYLPKSINHLGYSIFDGSENIKKVTVAYDTLTSGTTVYFAQTFNSRDGRGNGIAYQVEELTVLAPYEEDEPLKPTRVSYEDYKYHFDGNGKWTDERQERDGGNNYGSSGNSGYPRNNYQQSEVDYAHVETYKNIIAPNYFELMDGLKKVTIGEGMEFIGVKAFYSWESRDYPSFDYNSWRTAIETGKASNSPREWELHLPDSLKGIGNLAFTGLGGKNLDVNLPEGLEYIGIGAFRGSMALKGDFDLPNLVFLGDEAFMNTQIRDVTIYDTLRYFGRQVFAGCPYIRNITIDYDLFNPEKNAFHDTTRETFHDIYYWYYDKLWNNFGVNDDLRSYTAEQLEEIGINSVTRAIDGGRTLKYGTVKFTDKVVANYPEILYATSGSDAHGNYFAHIVADEIDLSECGWTVIPPYFFSTTEAHEILLPNGLETIMPNGLTNVATEEEFVLPDSIKVIDAYAFNQAANVAHGVDTLKITKLPESLEEVGAGAFYYDINLELDFDSKDIKIINAAAFMKTSVRDVIIRDKVEMLFGGAFEYIPTLRNITLDCDFFGINGIYSFYGVFSNAAREKSSLFQTSDRDAFNNVVFTEKNVTKPSSSTFLCFDINNLDISAVRWDRITNAMFYNATVSEPVALPNGIKMVERSAFMGAQMEILNAFAEGLEALGEGAFYATQVTGDITIPSTVTAIGWSAFNAGDADSHLNTVTIKPALDYEKTNNQAIFQMFWNTSVDKLIIESPMLPVLGTLQDTPIMPDDRIVDVTDNTSRGVSVPELREDGEPEFHGMTMKEVVITALPEITANAFEECGNLEKVTFSSDAALNRIDKYAFNNATKLKQVVFGEANNNNDISLETFAFNNTAIENMVTGDDSDFNLAAANFHTVDEYVFSNMPKLKTVEIPNNFNIDENLVNTEKNTNGSHITSFTFSDDPELSEATIGYQVSEIRDGAFLNDEKLAKMFIWGNAEIQESDDLIRDFNNTTIPKGTTIFAYSDAPAEDYANAESRDEYDGVFYALDEVLYLTTNKNFVILNDDKTDFDKEGLKLYAQRRDGVILESDNWQEYTTAFKRTEMPEGLTLNFEEGRGRVGSDEADIAGTVYDAPKPFDTISLANENYANVDFEMLTMPSSDNPLVIINYPEGYTGNIRRATLVSKTKEQVIEEVIEIITPTPEPEPEPKDEPEEELAVPDTGAFGAIAGAAVSSISIATIVVLGGIYIANKCRK